MDRGALWVVSSKRKSDKAAKKQQCAARYERKLGKSEGGGSLSNSTERETKGA